jgi:hypothetical protein
MTTAEPQQRDHTGKAIPDDETCVSTRGDVVAG